jgi:hypothetical protein
MRSRLIILLFAFVSILILFNREAYKRNMYTWDASGYYLYLPATFIYHDIGSLQFYHDVNNKYRMCDTGKMYGIFEGPEGKRNNKYALGTSLFELPLFLIAHAYCSITSAYPTDGYSPPYQFAGLLSNIFWVCAGLLLLSVFLKKYFTKNITAFIILCIAFGTNIYCYTTFAPGMSHPYSFFLFATILYCTDGLYNTNQQKYFYWIGTLLGLVIITRPVNIVVAIVPLLWNVYNKQSLAERLTFFGIHKKEITISLLLFFLISLLQLSYWKYTTSHWIYYTYIDEGFNFLRPRIIDGLFSYEKGWFVYTPIALISVVGMYAMWRTNKKAVPAISVFFLLMIYVVFSWKDWSYGGGFSARAMIETLPIAAFPLAYLSQSIYAAGKPLLLKIVFSAAMIFFITLNIFQSYQYNGNVIHYALMNRTYYWRIFGKTTTSEEDPKYLMTWDEYYKDHPIPKH